MSHPPTLGRRGSGFKARPRSIAVAFLSICGLALAAVAPETPTPPTAGWTGAGQTAVSAPITSCWSGASAGGGRLMVCADGVAPSCAGKRTDRLSLPSARAATVRVVLGFVPKAVFVTLTPTGGTGHDIRLPARRSLRVRVPADFTGTLTVFAPARQGGDAAYGICLERASAR